MKDARLPVMLAQRTVSPVPLPSASAGSTSDEMCGWTLTVPAGWGMAFWSSLVHAQARVGGLRERGQQSFEAGGARFPEDYPGTHACFKHLIRTASEDESYWLRCPPAKRPNYAKLGTPNPFFTAFEELVASSKKSEEVAVPPHGPLHLVPSLIVELLINKLNDSTSDWAGASQRVRDEVDRLATAWLALSPETPIASSGPFHGAIVRVRVVPIGRGAPEELAMIYRLGGDERAKLVEASKGPKEFDVVDVVRCLPDLAAQGHLLRLRSFLMKIDDDADRATSCRLTVHRPRHDRPLLAQGRARPRRRVRRAHAFLAPCDFRPQPAVSGCLVSCGRTNLSPNLTNAE